MTEILTESFCERCGTRYTFETVEAKRGPLGAIGTFGRGLKHFVSDPDTSFDEAFAVARSEQDQRSTTHALEAFHQTFNFCLNCRQYTCGDCWNVVEGRCLTCAPTPEAAPPETRSDTAVRLSALDLAAASAPILTDPMTPAETNGLPPELPPIDLAIARAEARAQVDAEQRSDEETRAAASAKAEEAAAEEWARITAEALAAEEAEAREAEARRSAAQAQVAAQVEAAAAAEAARIAAVAQAAAQAQVAADVEARAAAEAEAAAAAEAARIAAVAQAAAEAEARAAAEAAQVAEEARAVEEAQRAAETAARLEAELEAEAEAERVRLAFEPGRNLDDEIAAYERSLAETVEPVAEARAAEVEPEAVSAAAEPEPVVAEVEPVVAEAEPEPVVAEAELAEIPAEAEAEPVAAEEVAAVEPAVQPEAPAEELPVAAAAATPPPSGGVEPIPTAIGQPLPASVIDGPLAWPEPLVAAAAFEPAWPDTALQKRRFGAGLPAIIAPAQPLAARSCPGCGLSLSASARFCRRCGTPQQVDAAR